MEGQQIGAYRIERTLGQGGFGVVYVGVDLRLNRRAAIKQLLPELSGHRDIVERFFNEAKTAAAINHPGIVEIYDVGWHTDGSAYFAMKLLDGDSLAKRIRATGPLPVPVASTIARQVASALVAAHNRGIVHRDLKPDNIMLVPDEEVAFGERATVLDFGIAKLFGDKPLSQKTRTGMMMGTPAYMSPEQCRGAGEVDHRTDIYALGCILFEMLTGRPPFVGEGAGEVLGMHQFVEPTNIASLRSDLPPALAGIVMRTLAKRPEQRQQQMSELASLLQPFSTVGPRSMEQAAQSSTAHLPAATPLPMPVVTPQATPAPTPPPAASNPSTISRAGGEVVDRPHSRSKLPLVLVGIAVVGISIAVIAIASSGSKPEVATTPPPPDAASVIMDAAVTKLPADAAQTAAVDTKQLLAQARTQLQDMKWEDAIATAAAVSAREPANEEAKTIGRTAFAESKNEFAYNAFKDALKKAEPAPVKAAWAKIPDDSMFKAKARPELDAFVTNYMANAKRKAESLAGLQKCDEAKNVIAGATRMFPDAPKLADIACKTVVAAQPTPSETPSRPAPGTETLSVADLVSDANDAARNGEYAKAMRSAERALAIEPGNQQALTAAAIAACNLKNKDKAQRYIAKLAGQRQGMARQICLRNNVELD